jgi:hypothetical protein
VRLVFLGSSSAVHDDSCPSLDLSSRLNEQCWIMTCVCDVAGLRESMSTLVPLTLALVDSLLMYYVL